ncbi:MFS transporter [Saccharothrix longispora]|uniref:MFS transporter n=1 Tax=Saccharothrix longispora TaxID=33920 RepID=UPI0028FD4E42|nr:MFS transporter [Saccharothrix longispora]MDU0294116.1 MFS transporter [Saccharothrix longispora]
MLQALSDRDFRLLWLARSTSMLGSWLLVVAVPFQVLELTGSAMAAGLTLAAEFLPPVLLGPIAGVLVDRWDRRRVMIAADVLRAVAVSALLFVRDPADLWLVYVALVAESVGTLAFRPAAQAHLPVVVGTGPLLSSANSLNSFTDGVVRLAGAPLGGVLMGVVGFPALVWIDVAGYALSAFAIVKTAKLVGDRGEPGGVRRILAELVEGFAFLRGERMAMGLLVVNTLFLGANASLTVLLAPFGAQELGGSGPTGLAMSGLGIGFLIGAPPVRYLVDRVPTRYLLAGAPAATAVGFVLLFRSTSLIGALPAAVLIGVFGSAVLVTTQTALQRATPNAVLGRVSGVVFTGEAVATFAGAVLGSALVEVTSIPVTAYLAAAATSLSGVLALLVVPSPPAGTPRHDPS